MSGKCGLSCPSFGGQAALNASMLFLISDRPAALLSLLLTQAEGPVMFKNKPASCPPPQPEAFSLPAFPEYPFKKEYGS